MQRLIAFNSITLDGYFAGPGGDLSWAHAEADREFDEFVAQNASGGATLLFGRVTYDLMAAYWPTPAAAHNAPAVAEGMNNRRKVVFSRTMTQPQWNNTTLVRGDIAAAVHRMKEEPGEGMALLGSGSIIAQLTNAQLIDEYQIVVRPVVIGAGRTMFEGVNRKVGLRLTTARTFHNGNVFLCYEPER